MKRSPSPINLNSHLLSLACAFLLFLFLPAALRYRSPGGIDASWYLLVPATTVLLLTNLYNLFTRKVSLYERIGFLASSGIALLVAFMLGHAYQEQQAFDYWAHRGIAYNSPSNPQP